MKLCKVCKTRLTFWQRITKEEICGNCTKRQILILKILFENGGCLPTNELKNKYEVENMLIDIKEEK